MIWAKWMLAPRLGLDRLLATPFGPTYVAARFLTLSRRVVCPRDRRRRARGAGVFELSRYANGSGVKP
jgi:hypothetical protein